VRVRIPLRLLWFKDLRQFNVSPFLLRSQNRHNFGDALGSYGLCADVASNWGHLKHVADDDDLARLLVAKVVEADAKQLDLLMDVT